MVLWMASTGTPRAPPFSQSTSIRYWGTSSSPLGRTRVSLGSRAAMPGSRRREREHQRVANLRELSGGSSHQRVHFQVRTPAHIPLLVHDERHPDVLSRAGKATAGNRKAGFHRFLFIRQEMVSDLIQDLLGLLQGRTRRP